MSPTIGLSQGSLEERFAHILQPIRDLAKNWDIDIANYLEEYLEDLEKIEITFDDGATTMNFSEAALLIQGSAGVYAKKVEYLHALVFQVLDLVTQNKRQKGKQDGEKVDNKDDDNAGNVDEGFLPLDDIHEGQGIYLKELDNTSNKTILPVPETPTRLIPLEEAEKGDNAIFNKKGEVLGNHCDFNINMGYLSYNGSILLEMVDKVLLDMVTNQRTTMHDLVEEDVVSTRRDGFCAAMDDGGDGNIMYGDQEDVDDNVECNVMSPAETEKVNKESNLRRSECQKKVTFIAKNAEEKKPTLDPFALLDPYQKSKAVEVPSTKKKTYKIPACLEDKTTQKRKKTSRVKKQLAPVHEVVEKVFSHASKFPKNKLKVPEFSELEDSFWVEYKLREEVKKEQRKMLKKQENPDDFVEEEGDFQPDIDGFDGDDDGDNVPTVQLDADLFANDLAGVRLRPPPTGMNECNLSQDCVPLTYEDLVQRHVEKYLASAAEYAQITELSRRVTEWEEKISPKLEEEQTHPPFDIHKYGTDLIEKMVRGEKVAFRNLVTGLSKFEICRYTLAVLQLANVYNVELTTIPDQFGSIMDCLHVTLLSTKRHYECLEEYQAPSLQDS